MSLYVEWKLPSFVKSRSVRRRPMVRGHGTFDYLGRDNHYGTVCRYRSKKDIATILMFYFPSQGVLGTHAREHELRHQTVIKSSR